MNEEEKKTTPGTVEYEGRQNVRVCDCDNCKERKREDFRYMVLGFAFLSVIAICFTVVVSIFYSRSDKKSEEVSDHTNAVQILQEEIKN